MPNRIIRDSCKTSKSLSKLSAEAERMFWRLVTVADDFGRFEADPVLLLAKCFPLRVQDYKIRDISKWYAELESCKHVQTYVVNCYHYGFFIGWDKYQQCRAKASKYPAPADVNICLQPLADSLVVVNVNEVEKREARNVNEKREACVQAHADASGFEKFYEAYPAKKSPEDARKAWRKLSPDPKLTGEILNAIELQKVSRQEAIDTGRWVPEWKNPATWLNKGCWKDEILEVDEKPALGPHGQEALRIEENRGIKHPVI